MITDIYIGSERLELFEDETIKIKSTVAKIEDITKIFTDSSNSFTVPCSDRNNAIFNHWYEANVINGFDARKKVPAVIELSGVNFKVGKIRLNKVNFKSNQPSNYSIEFYGNLVELKDKLQDDKLTDLDLSSLDIDFDSISVRIRLTSINDLSFSLLSKRRLLYDSAGGITDDNKQTNIYYNGQDTSTGLKTSDVLGSVRQIKIIEAIEAKYDLTFSRDFLGGYDFSNQYLALSGTGDKTTFQIPLTNPDYGIDPTVSGNTMLSTGLGSSLQRLTKRVECSFFIDEIYRDVVYTCFIISNGVVVSKRENITGSITGGNNLRVNDSAVNGGLENVTFWIESSEPIEFNARVYRYAYIQARFRYSPSNLVPPINYNVGQRLPEIKIIEYLKGLFKKSKLVAIPQKDGSIYIDSLVNYYRKGKVYDLTEFIDYKSHTVSAGKILNEIKYQFEDPQTILNQQYKKNNGIGYGDLELAIYDDNGILIDGSKLEFKLPFEQIVYEKIIDVNDDSLDTNIQYGLLRDENLEPVTIKPHIHYIETKATNVKFINDDLSASNLINVNVPMQVLDTALQTFSTTFGSEFNTYNNEIINNTLFSNYHQKYIEQIFSIQKREYSYKAIDVPTNIVLNLNLNDVIIIKDNYYRIDEFETNTINNNVNFKLINDRNVDLTPLYPVSADSTIITADSTIITVDSTESEIIEAPKT